MGPSMTDEGRRRQRHEGAESLSLGLSRPSEVIMAIRTKILRDRPQACYAS